MNPIRAFARSAPRALFRASTTRRPLPSLRISSSLPSLLKPSFHLLRPTFCAAFSTSRTRSERAGAVDDELIAKVESELQMEKEMRDSEDLPASIRDYLENSPFKASPSTHLIEFLLTSSFRSRTFLARKKSNLPANSAMKLPSIKVVFSIADLNTLDTDSDRYDDPALYDEGSVDDGQSGGAQSKGAANASRTRGGNINASSKDNATSADLPDDEEADSSLNEDQDPSFPSRVNVTIEKAGQGALQIETVAQDGMIVIDNVYYYPSSELADTKSAEDDWRRRGMYTGPPFGNLDEDLQVLLERYLDERGVNIALALFIPDYIDHKEQREYISWLSNVKNFVEA